jgi:hypothetical protein
VPADATVTMLGRAGKLSHESAARTLTIRTPALGPAEAPCQHAYAFKITGAKLLPEKP